MFAQFKHLTWKASLLATIVSLLAYTIALAASGDLDTTFGGGDGLVISYPVPSDPGRSDHASDLAIQPNGKIVAVGGSYVYSTGNSDFAVLRFNTDGSLDSTFSGDGRLITNLGGYDRANGVAIQPNGKIVAVGEKCSSSSPCDVALVRYNLNGTLDTTFSGDGKQTSDFGGGDNGSSSLAIQSNGKIVLAGYMSNGTDNDFAVYRYLSNGTLDTTFSGDGMVNIGFGAGKNDTATDLVIQSDGKIVVAGYTGNVAVANGNFAISRLNTNGSLDTTFSGDGKLTTNFGGDDLALGVSLQADGKIVAVGEKFDLATNISSVAVARYGIDGSLDTTFNSTGKKIFSIVPGKDASAADVIVQPDGKIFISGGTRDGGGLRDVALVRLNSGGTLDSAFSGDGKVTINFGGFDSGIALALQPSDGKYIVAGSINTGADADFALARVLP